MYRWITQNVQGITYCNVVSNRTMGYIFDDAGTIGRPPKSVEVIVKGGKDQDIAEAVWKSAPGGIQLGLDETSGYSGIVKCAVKDWAGNTQYVIFSRPVMKFLWIKVFYTLYSPELFPSDGIAQVQQSIVDWSASEFQLGKDVIPSRILQGVYKIPGLGVCTVKCAVTSSYDVAPADTDYTDQLISISERNAVVVTVNRITMVKA